MLLSGANIDLIWVVAILYVFFDVNYFIRALFTMIFGSLFHRKCKITETTTLYGICLTNDVDMMLCHMNNARYLRELDFARYHFYERTGLFRRLFKARTITLQTASCMRYRQSISIFSAFKIQTKLVYWDTRNVYLEHQFRTLDGCVRAVGMSRQTILSGTIPGIFKDDTTETSIPSQPPYPTEELQRWISSMEASSQQITKSATDDGDRTCKQDEQRFNGFINR